MHVVAVAEARLLSVARVAIPSCCVISMSCGALDLKMEGGADLIAKTLAVGLLI